MKKTHAARMVLMIGIGLLALAGYGQFSGGPPGVRETFEPPADSPAAAQPQAWRVALGAAGVSAEASFAGALALKIEPGEPAGRVEFDVPADLAGAAFFVELRLLAGAPAARAVEQPAVAVSGAQAGLVRIGADSLIQVFDAAANAWKTTETPWPANAASNGGEAAPWVKLTLRIEPAADTWSLWVDGAPAAADMPLDLAAGEPLTLFGAGDQPVFVDNLYVGADNPLQRDVFDNTSNGTLPTGGDSETGDTSIAATGAPAGLAPQDDPDADPDHDGLTNAQEATLGTDQLRPDNPAVGLVVFTPLHRSKEQIMAERQRAEARREALRETQNNDSFAKTPALASP